jgi:hypothetical protein
MMRRSTSGLSAVKSQWQVLVGCLFADSRAALAPPKPNIFSYRYLSVD